MGLGLIMKTIVLEKPGEFIPAERPDLRVAPAGHALVRIHRVGVCGSDIHAYRGKQPFFTYPRVVGHELGVVVAAVGANEKGLAAGDRCAVEPYLHCGHCIACRRGKTNCCVSLQVLGVHGDGALATGSQTLASDRWYYIEGRIVISDTVGVVTIKIDGVQDINASGSDTRADATYATAERTFFPANFASYYVDDHYIVDTTGTANTSYLGDVRIKGYFPNGAGDNTGLTASAGSNYACVDEYPPNDATDYVYGTNTTNYDLYNIPDTSGATAVKAARLWWRGQKNDATSVNIAPVLKCDTDASGTADTGYVGSDVPLSSSWAYYSKTYDQQPDSTNWSPAKINALQIGVKSR